MGKNGALKHGTQHFGNGNKNISNNVMGSNVLTFMETLKNAYPHCVQPYIQWVKLRTTRWGNLTYCETLWRKCMSPYEMMG